MSGDDGCDEGKSQVGFRQELRIGVVQVHEIVDEIAPFARTLGRRVRGVYLGVQVENTRLVTFHSRRAQREFR